MLNTDLDFTPSATTPTMEQLDALSDEISALFDEFEAVFNKPLYCESVADQKIREIDSAPLIGFQAPSQFDGVSID